MVALLAAFSRAASVEWTLSLCKKLSFSISFKHLILRTRVPGSSMYLYTQMDDDADKWTKQKKCVWIVQNGDLWLPLSSPLAGYRRIIMDLFVFMYIMKQKTR